MVCLIHLQAADKQSSPSRCHFFHSWLIIMYFTSRCLAMWHTFFSFPWNWKPLANAFHLFPLLEMLYICLKKQMCCFCVFCCLQWPAPGQLVSGTRSQDWESLHFFHGSLGTAMALSNTDISTLFFSLSLVGESGQRNEDGSIWTAASTCFYFGELHGSNCTINKRMAVLKQFPLAMVAVKPWKLK